MLRHIVGRLGHFQRMAHNDLIMLKAEINASDAEVTNKKHLR